MAQRSALRKNLLFCRWILVFTLYTFSTLFLYEKVLDFRRNNVDAPSQLQSKPSASNDISSRRLNKTRQFVLLPHQESRQNTIIKLGKQSPYAYVYVIPGCNANDNMYRFPLYNVLIAAQILRQSGSTADIIVMIQISYESQTTHIQEETLLLENHVRVMYIPKSPSENFFSHGHLDKFRVWALTEYDRILFLEENVMPTANMDYLFELSVNGTFQQNVVLQGKSEPASAGLFLIQPGHFDEMQRILEKHANDVHRNVPFDVAKGWGHPIVPPEDQWIGFVKQGYNWTFHAAAADQGLLYYWVKYLRSTVTILQVGGKLEHWRRDENGTLQVKVEQSPLVGAELPVVFNAFRYPKHPPFGHFVQFTGRTQPWCVKDKNQSKEYSYWWENLEKIAQRHDIDKDPPDCQANMKARGPKQQREQLHLAASSKFAYVFVIGGCNPDKPTYRFYIYNVLIAAQVLRRAGSKAEVVALIQLAWQSSNSTSRIPEETILREYNVHVRYIPKSSRETFYRTNLDKFRILGLTAYERVLFMDGDVMPLANLDYLFELSTNGTFEENIVLQGKTEPANGGLFLLKPGNLEEINRIIEKREARAKETLEFDLVQGWGHPILPPDEWEGFVRRGHNWTFHAAFADQGLLYHWVKYVRGSVTIMQVGGKIAHWSRAANGELSKRLELSPLSDFDPPVMLNADRYRRPPPFGHFVHFTGKSKPWFVEDENASLASTFWKVNLREIAYHHDVDLGQIEWSIHDNAPSLGLYPKERDVATAHTNLLESLYS